MRMAFGLAGLLVTIAILAILWSSSMQQTARSGNVAREAAEQIAGVESSGLGGRVSDHMQLGEYTSNGKLEAITVKKLETGSSMQTYYGLRQGDQIVEVGPMKVRDMDGGLATAMVQEAYQRQSPLVVWRNGQRLELPREKEKAVPPAAPVPTPQPQAAKPAAPTPAPAPAAAPQPAKPTENPLQRQMDLIKGYGQ